MSNDNWRPARPLGPAPVPDTVKPRPELLALAEAHGARLTGKPDGSEAITIVFTIEAWRAFDAALALPAGVPVAWLRSDPRISLLNGTLTDEAARLPLGEHPLYAHPPAAQAPAVQAQPTWRCFHCDEAFTDEAAARLHFGESERDKPACQYSIEHIRWMEAQHRRNVEDDSEALRCIRALCSEHERLRRLAEEEGYARGLADARKHPADLGLQPVATAEATEPVAPDAQHSKRHGLFFTFDCDAGFRRHATAEDAKAWATEVLRGERKHAQFEGEWSGNVEEVCWGEVREAAVAVDVLDDACDYKLLAAQPAAVPSAAVLLA